MTDTAAPTPQLSQPRARSPWWRTALLIYGGLMLAFGVAAALAPLVATFAASVAFGGLLFASGVVGLVTLAVDWRAEAFIWRLIWSAIAIVGGLCILLHPWPGALALTIILGASLIAQGLAALGHAFAHRRLKACPWGQMAFAGVLSIVLGGLLVWALPHAGMIVPGAFLALNLMSFGLSLIAVALSQNKVPT